MSKKTTFIIVSIAIMTGYFIFLYAFPNSFSNTNTTKEKSFKPISANKTFGKYPNVKL
jgi:hypothetical protein